VQVTSLPQWIGAAILGALIALIGWLGKQLVAWFAALRAEERQRRAQLAELLALLRAGDVAFRVQKDNRNRLSELIRVRDPTSAKLPYDKQFAGAFPSMPDNERELFEIIRAYTIFTFQPLNAALLKWLAADVTFRVRAPGQTRRAQLANYLADLEAHLLLWQAKYNAWIPDHPERALVYLEDEERHGVRFPQGGTKLVEAILHQQRRVGA
jgi:hypothetical protein